MPIADEHQSGVRRYAVFTFVIDDQGGVPGSPALRFPQSPHSSSLEVSTRLRHCESFFMKRLKSLEKGFVFPFVDVSFFSSYQNIDEMKRLLEPTDCVNFHDAAIHLQKGCYEEVQLVDPKRDMIQTPIDDDDDDELGSGSGSASADANRNDPRSKPKIVHPPGIQPGADDYKKTRGYIMIGYKTMEYMYSREFLSSWKTWTGVRYICMQMPRQLGLRRIAFYRQLSCTSDFSYVLLIEVTNLLLYAAQTLNLMDRIKLRLCGCAGVFRETDFQVDPVTANVHHLNTNYRPPEKPIAIAPTLATTLERLDSVNTPQSSLGGTQPSRKSSQALATNGTAPSTSTSTTNNGNASANVDTLMQLLKQQQEAAARRKATMEAPLKAKKRHSLAPPEYPAPTLPSEIDKTIPAPSSSSQPEIIREETSKKAPTALAESEDSEVGNSSPSVETAPQKSSMHHSTSEKRMFQHQPVHFSISTQQHQLQQQQQSTPPQHQMQQRSVYHSTAPLYPIEISTAISSPIPQQHPYYAQYHQAETLPMQQQSNNNFSNVYAHQILTHPMDHSILQNRQPLKEMIANDYHPMYTYNAKPVSTSPFGFVQATADQRTPNDYLNYNSPVYSRQEWKQSSNAYRGQSGEESIRNLAEQFRSLRETPIIGSDPYLVSSTDSSSNHHYQQMQNRIYGNYDDDRINGNDEFAQHRERSRSAVVLDDPRRRVYFHQQRQQPQNRSIDDGRSIDRSDRSKREKQAQAEEQLQQTIAEAEKLQLKLAEVEKLQQKKVEAEKLQLKLVEAEKLQQKIVEAEKLQLKIAEAEMLQQKIAEAERFQQQQQQEQKKSDEKTPPTTRREREKTSHKQKSTPKLDETPGSTESPTFSPKRRIQPKMPPVEISIDQEIDRSTKRRHDKKDRPPIAPKPVQQQSPPSATVDVKEIADGQPQRQRPRNGASSEKKPTKEKPEQSNGSNGSKLTKSSPVHRASRRPENGGDKSRQASTSGNGRKAKSPAVETLSAPLAESANGNGNGRHGIEKSRKVASTESRSRSRDDMQKSLEKPKTTASATTLDQGASTSVSHLQKLAKSSQSAAAITTTTPTDHQPATATTSKNGSGATKPKQSPRKRK